MTSFFHAYDLRGKHPEEIDVEEARRVGRAYGTWLDAESVIVGRDGRTHGKKVMDAFVEGITSTGTNVLDAGMVPSPVVYYGSSRREMHAAVVTASHNPPEYTGFKFAKPGALAVSRDGGMAEIERIYEDKGFETGEGSRTSVELGDEYVEFVAERIELERELDVMVNFGNSVNGHLGRRMLEEIGCSVEGVNEEVDGTFPAHLPDPGEEEAQEYLLERMDGSEDLGILFDGDGDRAGFIVGGSYVDPDETLALLAERSLSREKGRVIHDLRASKLVGETIRENGGTAVESRVGHTFISEAIHEDGAVFAGELSGHYYFPAFDVPWDDGLFAAALFCEIASREDLEKKLAEMPEYPVSPELRIDCPHEAKKPVIESMKERFSDHELTTVDGVKIEFENGWALVRPSNTQPKMSVRCEADTEKDLESILEEVESAVRKAIELES